MRNRMLCAVLSLCLVVPSGAGADIILVVNSHGAYTIDTSTPDPVKTTVVVDRILIDSGVGVPGPGDPKDPGDPKPPGDALTERIAAISRQHIQTAKEAQALIATINMLVDLVDKGSLKPESLDAAIKTGLPVIALQLKAGTRLQNWYAAVKEAGGGAVDRNLLDKARAALAFVFKVDAAKLQARIEAARERVETGATVSGAAEAVTDTEAEAFDIGMILMIIQAILELLKAIGILGG